VDTYRHRIRDVSVSGAYRTRDMWPECRVRVTEAAVGGVFALCTLFVLSSCPVLNTAVSVVQTAGGVSFLVVQS